MIQSLGQGDELSPLQLGRRAQRDYASDRLGVTERVLSIGDLLGAVLPLEPNRPVRVKRNFTVIEGGKN